MYLAKLEDGHLYCSCNFLGALRGLTDTTNSESSTSELVISTGKPSTEETTCESSTDEASTSTGDPIHNNSEIPDAQSRTEETSSIAALRSELNNTYESIHCLKSQIVSLTPFTESSLQLQSKEFIQHYTGLPNFKIVKAVYDFVSSSSTFGNTKLAPFQYLHL